MIDKKLWKGLSEKAQNLLQIRDYKEGKLGDISVPASKYLSLNSKEKDEFFIPGVEIFNRQVFNQKFRGYFGELMRLDDEDILKLGFTVKQWASARMFAGSAKGFHIHPPYIPDGEDENLWFKKNFIDNKEDFSLREYDKEQWDIMFIVQGCVEFILVDERAGMERKKMRFSVLGDEHGGQDNVKILIPPGVAHALRCDARADSILVYGTSLTFDPKNEGRICSDLENDSLPKDWDKYYYN